MEVAAAHLDDRAEAAVVGAAARRLDDVDRPAEQRVSQHASRAVRRLDRCLHLGGCDRPWRGCSGRWTLRRFAPETRDRRQRHLAVQGAHPDRPTRSGPPSLRTMKSTPMSGVRPASGARLGSPAADHDANRRGSIDLMNAMIRRAVSAGRSSRTGRPHSAADRASGARRSARTDDWTRTRSATGDLRGWLSTFPASDASAPIGHPDGEHRRVLRTRSGIEEQDDHAFDLPSRSLRLAAGRQKRFGGSC